MEKIKKIKSMLLGQMGCIWRQLTTRWSPGRICTISSVSRRQTKMWPQSLPLMTWLAPQKHACFSCNAFIYYCCKWGETFAPSFERFDVLYTFQRIYSAEPFAVDVGKSAFYFQQPFWKLGCVIGSKVWVRDCTKRCQGQSRCTGPVFPLIRMCSY